MEHGTIIFVVCFLGAFIFISGLIPNSLLANLTYNEENYSDINYPDKRWDTSAIGEGNITDQDLYNITVNEIIYLHLGGEEVKISWPIIALQYDSLYVYHNHFWWIFTFAESTNLCPVSKSFLSSINEDGVSSITCFCLKGDLQFLFQVSFDNLTYADLEEAWNSGYLMLRIALRNTDTQTVAHYDAWTLIGQLLTFQAPLINPLFNYLIAIPLWVSIIIAIIYVLDKILPF